MKIVIDPGHSGPVEPGACAEGVQECDVVLAIAKLLAEQRCEQGYAGWRIIFLNRMIKFFGFYLESIDKIVASL